MYLWILTSLAVIMPVLTHEVIFVLHEAVLRQSEPAPNGGCLLYTGQIATNGYGLVRKTIGGTRYQVYAHQLMLFHQLGLNSLPVGMVSSHLCHNRLCIATAHLILEPSGHNLQRNACLNDGSCKGNHRDYLGYPAPNCIFF